MEQLDSGQLNTSDIVTASAHASSMGGSQIWLKEGEQMSVDEMLKCIAVNSANIPPSPWLSTSPVPRRRSPNA